MPETTKTVLLREDFTDPDLPGWVVLDGGATTWPATENIDAGPPAFGTWEVESCWADQVTTGPDGLRIALTKDGGSWRGGRIYHEQNYKAEPGQVLRFEFACTLPDLGENGRGHWYAGWMMASVHKLNRTLWPPNWEIDVFEGINGAPGVAQTTHLGGWGKNPLADGGFFLEPDGIGTGLVGADPWGSGEELYAWEHDRTTPGRERQRYYRNGVLTKELREEDFPSLTWHAGTWHDGFYPIFNTSLDGGFPKAVGALSNERTGNGGFTIRYCEVSVTGVGTQPPPPPAEPDEEEPDPPAGEQPPLPEQPKPEPEPEPEPEPPAPEPETPAPKPAKWVQVSGDAAEVTSSAGMSTAELVGLLVIAATRQLPYS